MTSAAQRLPAADDAPAPVFTVLVVVGTDHHRFDRLVDWMDDWAQRQPGRTRVVFQHGSARAPRFGEGHALLAHEDLQELMASASVLVTHGGPATICEAWRHGRLPVVVPRDPVHGEHVDGHQLRFSRRLGGAGLVLLCEQQEELEQALEQARRDPGHVRVGEDNRREAAVAASVHRVAQVIDGLLDEAAGRPRRGLRRLLTG